MISRLLTSLVAVLLTLIIAAVIWANLWGKDVLLVANGSISHALCAAAFESKVDPDRLFQEEEKPHMRGLDLLLHYDIDRDKHEVRATIAGGFLARAVYRPGLGCLVTHATGAVPEAAGLPQPTYADAFADPNVVEPTDAMIRKALDDAFTDADPAQPRNTKAFVVLHNGKLIAERYASGYGPTTPIWAHSISKSLTSALIGILVRQGKLRVDMTVPLPAWQTANDARHEITIDELLRMTSGLPFDDNDDVINHLTRMLFLEGDLAGYAEQVPLDHAPGSTWNYSNVGFMILSRLIRDVAGGNAVETELFARNELFEPLGMRNATLDCDATGTPIGASNSYASARDWARFGQLYLDDGVVDGRRILPEGWVAYTRSQTLATGYGAGFWTNLVNEGAVPVWDAPWGMPSLPKDMFYARGALGQYIVVVPSEQLVVARLGIGYGGVEKAIANIIVALHAQQNTH